MTQQESTEMSVKFRASRKIRECESMQEGSPPDYYRCVGRRWLKLVNMHIVELVHNCKGSKGANDYGVGLAEYHAVSEDTNLPKCTNSPIEPV